MPRPVFLAGRDGVLADLHAWLSAGDGIGPQVMSLYGLAGTGKTSVALEYAYRHLADLGMVWQLPAEEPTALAAGFDELAAQLGARDLLDVGDPVARVHAALAARRGDWLLIFDNAPGLAALQEFLPPAGQGRVLITSHDPDWPGQAMEVPALDLDVAAAYLVTRTSSGDQVAAEELAVELDGLPLALAQACAYMQTTGRSIAGYLALFQQRRAELLARGAAPGHPATVAAALGLALSRLEESDPAAAGLLRMLACCAPDQIPLNLLLQPRPQLEESLGPEVAPLLLPLLDDPLAADTAVAALRRYSLIGPLTDGSVSVHRLVQAVALALVPADQAEAWRRAARAVIDAALPADIAQPETWPICSALLPHLQRAHQPMDEWMLSWLARSGPLLVGHAPRAAAELLRQGVASSVADPAQHDRLAGWLAEALYRVGDVADAEQVANLALEHAADPDLVADLHWTLAQCSMRGGSSAESQAMLDRALAAPGILARHRARLLVLAARTHSNVGEVEKAGRVAASALAEALEAGDNWAIGWALHVLTIVTAEQGKPTDALPLFDRALAVTDADPSLTDLRLLLQINKALALGDLDRHEEAFAEARQAQQLADQAGTVIRQGQVHCALAQLSFDAGRWEDALAEAQAMHDDLKELGCACCDLGIAAVICFHRGEISAARAHLAAAMPYAERIGNRVIPPLVLARSLDREHDGDLPGALAELTIGFASNAEELAEIEGLLPDAVRLATEIGDLGTARRIADQAVTLAADSETPHRQAAALYCRGVLDHDGARLLAAALRSHDADRPLLRARALEAAARAFVRADDRGQARPAFTGAIEIYASLGADTDVARLRR
jgi:tetratricopeptide (TPR) repeat protein